MVFSIKQKLNNMKKTLLSFALFLTSSTALLAQEDSTVTITLTPANNDDTTAHLGQRSEIFDFVSSVPITDGIRFFYTDNKSFLIELPTYPFFSKKTGYTKASVLGLKGKILVTTYSETYSEMMHFPKVIVLKRDERGQCYSGVNGDLMVVAHTE